MRDVANIFINCCSPSFFYQNGGSGGKKNAGSDNIDIVGIGNIIKRNLSERAIQVHFAHFFQKLGRLLLFMLLVFGNELLLVSDKKIPNELEFDFR